jgi:hypothetical protein
MTAQRDWSFAEFRAAARRNHFEPVMSGLWLQDTTNPTGTMFGCVSYQGAINYRESLAQAIKQRAAEVALGQKVIKLAAKGKTDDEIAAATSKTRTEIALARHRAEQLAEKQRARS